MFELERTTQKTVVFTHSFVLDEIDAPLPAGSYHVETDEELLPGLSFIAYRRVRTTITLPAIELVSSMTRQVVTIDPAQLETALAADTASNDLSKQA
jgi:hypothetical protein